MLRISKLADYGTVIMNCLAAEPTRLFNANEVAKKVHISLPTVSKLLKLLVGAELISSVRGPKGGYRLARPPKQISLAEVITALDGQPALTECNQSDTMCMQSPFCALRDNWRIINKVIMNSLHSFTLADMMNSLHQHPIVIESLRRQSKDA